ncbi:hypothetical protein CC86DRAFT_419477 [Ophiobolus disseminans]|uniref:Gfd2/YDR514C-like C-terminal domain-containing protein n=1 Tax=Ophiobolus disseminans TaxID=1469910 RepID=A0A6A6ZWK8_9PLEO|nr:hypothetical protein CC86DRAFT_419477 [Ophiobolus disseminans]
MYRTDRGSRCTDEVELLSLTLLSAKHQQGILHHYLYQNQDDVPKEAVLVTLHRKWSNQPPYVLTEIGISTYTRQHLNCGFPCPPGPHAEGLLHNVWCMHLRICRSPHLPSTDASPDAFLYSICHFHFGTSVFVTEIEAQDWLYTFLYQQIDEVRPEKGYRPVICITYGENDALGKIRKADLDFVPINMDTTIAMVNAQDIAVQANITRHHNATIEYVLPIFKITPFHVGNAGNAAMYATIIAFLSVLRHNLYHSEDNPRAKPGQKSISSTKTATSATQGLMEHPTPVPPFGVTTYCGKSLHSMPLWS